MKTTYGPRSTASGAARPTYSKNSRTTNGGTPRCAEAGQSATSPPTSPCSKSAWAQALRSVITHPSTLGGVNRMIRTSARIKADQPTERLIAEIRAMVGSRRHNVGVTSLETLTDILVHGQDIAIPLHRELAMPRGASAVVATRVWAQHGTRMARVFDAGPLQGFRFTATDVPWSVGRGREIQGPIAAVLLLLTGRLATLPQLSGDGAESLRKQLLPA